MNDEPEKTEITPDTFPKYKPASADYPPHLKDPANYKKIRKAILDAGATPHSHSDMAVWAGCRKCQLAALNRTETMKHLGFKSGAHYLAWQRIHETIERRVPIR